MRKSSRTKRQSILRAVFAISLLLTPLAKGEPADLADAVQPLDEGVPQVAVLRLREVLARELSPDDRKTVTARLGEALLAAGDAEKALQILQDPSLQDLVAVALWRAQALASLQRWTEALPLYQRVAAQSGSSLQAMALFGQAEALRALHRPEEALQLYGNLFSNPQWNSRAQLRSVELLLEKQDAAGARGLLA